ncbi:MAG: hypothetical protein ACREYF_05765 [Gammaproteobacteria bacterium]
MSLDDHYVDLRGCEFSLDQLDADERRLLNTLMQRADRAPSWHEFANFWMKLVGEFYHGRGLSRPQVRHTALYRIAQDLGSRLAVAQGVARTPDYRDEIEELIRARFKTRREFCEATGLSEDMLSHVLARRKHIAIDTLSDALSRIGCFLRIVPQPGPKRPRRNPKAAA